MKKFCIVGAMVFLAAAGWRLGGVLSADALGMALGVLFGMMTGIPAMLLALSVNRRPHPTYQQGLYAETQALAAQSHAGHHPPVIIVAGGMPQHLQQQSGQHYGALGQPGVAYPTSYATSQPAMLSMPRRERHFTVLGEQGEDW